MEKQPSEIIRLVCLDVDGTLLDSKLQLHETVKSTIHAASRMGIAFAIVTGRNLDSSRAILEALGLKVCVITCGGAHIMTMDGVTQEIGLDITQVNEIVNLALGAGSGLFVDGAGPSWALGNEDFVRRYAGISTSVHTTDLAWALRLPPLKVSIINEKEVLDDLRLQISQRYPELQLAAPFDTVVDVTHSQATKGFALRTLTALIGVSLEQVAALGDSENDMSMFRESGLSIAMANAPINVRASADWIAPSNDEQGVAWAVNRIVASNRRISTFCQ